MNRQNIYVMTRNAKGSRRERQLVEFLNKQGYVCHRVAGSGHMESATCDLVAIKNGKPFLVEVKSRKKIFYTKSHLPQLHTMIKEAKRCGAVPLLAVKINYKPWKIINISKDIPKKV
jgi:Holliday junction resolvase